MLLKRINYKLKFTNYLVLVHLEFHNLRDIERVVFNCISTLKLSESLYITNFIFNLLFTVSVEPITEQGAVKWVCLSLVRVKHKIANCK